MRFGKTLQSSFYEPWQDKYLDYPKLKSMLREDEYEEDESWTENDETRFSDEIFNVQLEKVTSFHEGKFKELKDRVDSAFEKLKELPTSEDGQPRSELATQRLKELEAELDAITNEVNELKRYSNINYTGFLKIVKKHDRKRGLRYKIRPLMMQQLSDRPFNSEQAYGPLIHRLSLAYFTVKQQLEEGVSDGVMAELQDGVQETRNGETYSAHKCKWNPTTEPQDRSLVADLPRVQSGYIQITCSRSRPSSCAACPTWCTARSRRRRSTGTKTPA